MKSALAFLLTAAPEAHEPQLIDIDHTVFVQLGIFLVLFLVLSKFLWKPYLRVRTERVARVEGYREEAAKLEVDAQQRLNRADAALAEATAAAQRKLADARTRLTAAIAAERKKLDADSSEVAVSAARKILGREVSA